LGHARDEIAEIDERLDRFDFQEEERKISRQIVEQTEEKISDINSDLYDLDSDVAQLERSISRGIKFDLSRIATIFEESKIVFPEAVSRTYDELVDFNKRLTTERNQALKAKAKELKKRRDELLLELETHNSERQRLLRIVKDADTFRKYKSLQNEQAQRRAQLTFLESQLVRIDAIEEIERRLRDRRQKRDDQITAIEVSLQRGSPIKTAVTQLFNRYVKQILSINGEFIVGTNKQGNIEFEIKTKDAITGSATSQDRGHSYHRLLCALFDIAVLKALEDTPFYHFVYHDGIFEGLDNRRKLGILELIKDCTASSKIQYILSVIDSDLPRSPDNDSQLHFTDEEVVIALNDSGDEGRLFKMAPF
jgi:uncharacterized protein YydD (DUF2326 family)